MTLDRFQYLFAVAAVLLAVCAAPLEAQRPRRSDGPTVSASGSTVVQRRPTALVLHINLIARGKDVTEALKNLETRRKSAGTLLQGLGAEAESMKFAQPTASSAAGESRQQLEQMIRERIRSSGGAAPEGLKIPESVTLTQSLTARWPLKARDPSALLAESETLMTRIKDADLAGVKMAGDASPAEQELIEESAMQAYGGYSSSEEERPGTPQFAFAADISQADRKAALRKAFQDARKQAAELAAAAGMEVGGLADVSSGMSQIGEYDPYGYGGYARNSQMLQRLRSGADADSNESYSAKLGPVNFNFQVSAVFYLEPPSKQAAPE